MEIAPFVENIRQRLPLAKFESIIVEKDWVEAVVRLGASLYLIEPCANAWRVREVDEVEYRYTVTGPHCERIEKILMGWKRDDSGELHPPASESRAG